MTDDERPAATRKLTIDEAARTERDRLQADLDEAAGTLFEEAAGVGLKRGEQIKQLVTWLNEARRVAVLARDYHEGKVSMSDGEYSRFHEAIERYRKTLK